MARTVAVPQPGPRGWMSGLVLSVGLVASAGCPALIVVRGVRAISTPSTSTPAVVERHLAHGTWVVFERTSTSGATDGTPDLAPSMVKVTGPDGVTPTRVDDSSETLTRDDDVYSGAVAFTVRTPGDYAVAVTPPEAVPVILTRSLGDTIAGLVPLIVGGVLGGLLALTGIGLFIVGAVRRSRARARRGPLPPAGWYPDPQQPAQRRLWDGDQWR